MQSRLSLRWLVGYLVHWWRILDRNLKRAVEILTHYHCAAADACLPCCHEKLKWDLHMDQLKAYSLNKCHLLSWDDEMETIPTNLPNNGTASEVAGIVSATIFKNTVRDSRMVTPVKQTFHYNRVATFCKAHTTSKLIERCFHCILK